MEVLHCSPLRFSSPSRHFIQFWSTVLEFSGGLLFKYQKNAEDQFDVLIKENGNSQGWIPHILKLPHLRNTDLQRLFLNSKMLKGSMIFYIDPRIFSLCMLYPCDGFPPHLKSTSKGCREKPQILKKLLKLCIHRWLFPSLNKKSLSATLFGMNSPWNMSFDPVVLHAFPNLSALCLVQHRFFKILCIYDH